MVTPGSEQQTGLAAAPAPSTCSFPFVCRQKELARLSELHTQRKHALILGPAGVGKSALVGQLREQLSLLVSARSAHLGAICADLEPQLGLEWRGLRLLERKRRLREALAAAQRTVVFDGVAWISPKLSRLFEGVTEQAPVWICARSEHPWDIGHFWPLLVRFTRVQLRPFHPSETQLLIEAAVAAGRIPAAARKIAHWLQRRSGGSPHVLCELFEELATGKYDLSNPQALRRLDLDRRIHEVLPGTTFCAPPPRGTQLDDE